MKITKSQLKQIIKEELNNQYFPGARLKSHLDNLDRYDLPNLAVDERARARIRNDIKKEYYSRNSPLLFGLYDRPVVIKNLFLLGKQLRYLISRANFRKKGYNEQANKAKQMIDSLTREIEDLQQRYRDAE